VNVAVDERCESSIRFDLFELDSHGCQLRRSGVVVDLPRQALKVLALLIAHPNELVTRKEIKEALWPDEVHGDFDSRMNFAVKRLREALGDNAEQPRYVQTVRNAGYMFIAPVRMVQEVSEGNGYHLLDRISVDTSPSSAQPSVAMGSALQRGSRSRVRAILLAVITASVVAVAAYVLKPRAVTVGAVQPDTGKILPVYIEGVPEITSVGALLPQARQRIVIKGRGFGMHTPYANTDSPYLAIGDDTRDWAAGRMIPNNWDEVKLDVERWNNNEIVISGFSGDYGKNGWELVAGDRVNIRVWNPQTGSGPALFRVTVTSADAKR
jgi:DNA-binding winged helix-turn-helix (wHTH) protein